MDRGLSLSSNVTQHFNFSVERSHILCEQLSLFNELEGASRFAIEIMECHIQSLKFNRSS